MDRATGGARQGILFSQEVLFPQTEYAIYAVGEPPFDLREALSFVGEMGFGGLASVGLGTFQVVGEEEVELPEARNPNAYTSLAPGPLEGALYYELEPTGEGLGVGTWGPNPSRNLTSAPGREACTAMTLAFRCWTSPQSLPQRTG